jgi:hypothetical protein
MNSGYLARLADMKSGSHVTDEHEIKQTNAPAWPRGPRGAARADHPALELHGDPGGGKNRSARAARNPFAHIVRL